MAGCRLCRYGRLRCAVPFSKCAVLLCPLLDRADALRGYDALMRARPPALGRRVGRAFVITRLQKPAGRDALPCVR